MQKPRRQSENLPETSISWVLFVWAISNGANKSYVLSFETPRVCWKGSDVCDVLSGFTTHTCIQFIFQ